MKNFVEMCDRWVFFVFLFFSGEGVHCIHHILKEVCNNCSLGCEETEGWKTETKGKGQSFLKFFDSYKIKFKLCNLRPLIIHFHHGHTLNFCLLIFTHSLLQPDFFAGSVLYLQCSFSLEDFSLISPYLTLYSFCLNDNFTWIHFLQMKIIGPFAKLP